MGCLYLRLTNRDENDILKTLLLICLLYTSRLRVAEMANYFGIGTWFHRNVAELSGGQKQLLNLASIMAMQPLSLIHISIPSR